MPLNGDPMLVRVLANMRTAFGGLPPGVAAVPEPTDADRLCEAVERLDAPRRAAADMERLAGGDLNIEIRLSAEPYPTARLDTYRECPLVLFTIDGEFRALDDEPAEIHRQIVAGLRDFLDSWERRLA